MISGRPALIGSTCVSATQGPRDWGLGGRPLQSRRREGMPQQGGFSPLHRETPQHHSLAKLWAKDLGGPKVPGDMYAHPLPSSPLTPPVPWLVSVRQCLGKGWSRLLCLLDVCCVEDRQLEAKERWRKSRLSGRSLSQEGKPELVPMTAYL
jgi:hypothetical protein